MFVSLRLPNAYTVLKGEIYAINIATNIISQISFCTWIHVYVDNLIAIKTLKSNIVKSKRLYY